MFFFFRFVSLLPSSQGVGWGLVVILLTSIFVYFCTGTLSAPRPADSPERLHENADGLGLRALCDADMENPSSHGCRVPR